MTTTALLLSGGIDSAAVAAWKHPDIALFIDYGQRSAFAERRAARAVAAELGIRHHELTVGLDALGAGVLKDDVMNRPGFDAHLLSREGNSHHAEEVRRGVQGPGGAVGR